MKSLASLGLLACVIACSKAQPDVGPGSGSSAASAPGPAAKPVLASYPGTEAGAQRLVADLRVATDPVGMTRGLVPTSADYTAVFEGAAAAAAEQGYTALWADPTLAIGADPANTEVIVGSATTDDLKKWTPAVEADFPGGYKRAAAAFKPGLTVYHWKYVKPGEQLGMAFDGLIYVNGHWAFFPKPWRVLGDSIAPRSAPVASAPVASSPAPVAKPAAAVAAVSPGERCRRGMASIQVTAHDARSCSSSCSAITGGMHYVCDARCRQYCR